MYLLKYPSFLKLSFLILLGILASCSNEKPGKEVVFRYSDGTRISDSSTIRLLTRQLPLQVKEYDSTISLNVTTCLDKKVEKKLKKYLKKDSLRKVSGMVIMENKTGNVISCKNSEELAVYRQQLQTMKMYGILLSLENGVKLDDTFSWTGKYTKRKYDTTVARLYRMSAPSLEYKYPFDDYSCSKWSTFLQKLEVSENERDCADGEIYPRYYFRTSLIDLVKTGVLINQNGVATANNLFGNITGAGGKLLHKPVLYQRRRLKTGTCIQAKKIMKRDPFDVIEFSYPIFFYTHSEIRNGMIVSTKKYTIGFLSASKSINSGFVTKEIYSLVSLLENS